MRFFAPFLAFFAAVALAQDRNNVINNGANGLAVTAGQPLTITWTNPSSGTVTIKLTQGNVVQPGDGITLQSNVQASAGTATVQIPSGSDLNGQQYNIEIIDDTNTDNVNFSSGFTVSGASGTGSTSASGSMTSSASATSMSDMSSTTDSSSASASSSAASHSSKSSASKTSASASSTSSVSAINGASAAKAGGMLAVMAAAAAVF